MSLTLLWVIWLVIELSLSTEFHRCIRASCSFAERLQQMVAEARKFTLAAQQRQKRYYDAKHRPAVFAVNDRRLLSTSGLDLKIAGTNKLAPCFVGPSRSLSALERLHTGWSCWTPCAFMMYSPFFAEALSFLWQSIATSPS